MSPDQLPQTAKHHASKAIWLMVIRIAVKFCEYVLLLSTFGSHFFGPLG